MTIPKPVLYLQTPALVALTLWGGFGGAEWALNVTLFAAAFFAACAGFLLLSALLAPEACLSLALPDPNAPPRGYVHAVRAAFVLSLAAVGAPWWAAFVVASYAAVAVAKGAVEAHVAEDPRA